MKRTRLYVTRFKSIGIVDAPACEGSEIVLAKRLNSAEATKAVWDTAYINTLPDSSFALVESGGEKDDEGKTTPRSLRHLPFKNAEGTVDLPHLRNALARLPQSSLSDQLKAKAQRVLNAAAKEAGVGAAAEKEAAAEEAIQEIADAAEKVGKVLSTASRAKLQAAIEALQALMATGETPMPMMDRTAAAVAPEAAGTTKGDATMANTTPDLKEDERRALPAAAQAVLKAKDELIADLRTKLTAADPMAGEAEALKDLSPAAQELVKAARAEAAEARKIADEERDRRESSEYIEKAKAYEPVCGPAGEAGPRLRRLESNTATTADITWLNQKLAGAAEIARKSMLFRETGRSAHGVSGNAREEVLKLARELRTKDPSISPQQAFIKALDADTDLAERYRKEQAGTH